jgi:glutamate transport system permease protein
LVSFVIDNFPLLRSAFLTTLSLAVVSGICALALGTVLAGMRVSPVPPLRGLATFYVEVFRNTPLTVVFFFLVFGIVEIGLQFPSRFSAAVAGLSLYTAAFVCEALRSGINAVPPGQAEAARALGFDFRQSLRLVVLPQAFRTVVPPLGNVWIALAKNTSIAAGFAVTDLTAALQRLSNVNAARLLAVFLTIVVAYLLITLPSAWAIRAIEKRVAIVR